VICLPGLGGQPVVARGRSIFYRAPSRVLITMARVLDQLLFGLLKALGLALAGLYQWPLSLAWATLDGR
jgi:hypothetical protein